MAQGRVRIPITADATGVRRGTQAAERELQGFQKRTEAGIGRLNTGAASLGLAFGVTGLALGIKQATEAYAESEKVQSRLAATQKTLGINNAAARKEIDATVKSQSKLGAFDTEALVASYTQFLQVTKSQSEATKLNALAMDLARGKGISLQSAQLALLKAYNGNYTALNRMGVQIAKGTSSTAAFAQVQARFAGQAKQYGESNAAAVDKTNIAFVNLERTLGRDFAPTAAQAAQGLEGILNVTGQVADSVGGLGPIVAGAAGFGAFRLVAPEIGAFTQKVALLRNVTKGEGVATSLKFMGSEAAGMVSPMTLAAAGVAVLAGGIYELWTNSEDADGAIRTLGSDIAGLNSAMGQQQTAHENLALAKIDDRKATEALNAGQKAARGLHSQVIADNKAEASSVDAAKAALAKYGANSKQYIQAYHDAGAATSKAAGTTKAYNDQLKQNGDLAVYAGVAHDRLKAAHENVKTSAGGVADALSMVDKKAQDVNTKVIAQTALTANLSGNWREFGKQGKGSTDLVASGAAHYAAAMETAASKTAKSDGATRTAEQGLAAFAKQLGRIPTKKEFNLIVNEAAAGADLDTIKSKIDALASKQITLRFNSTFKTPNPINPTTNINPKTGKPFGQAATGAWIGGAWTGVDSVPVTVAPGEAILNPDAIALADSGMTVAGALSAIGAPTITAGGHYSASGVPIKTSLSQAGLPTPGRVPAKAKASKSSSSRGAAAKKPKSALQVWQDAGGKLPGDDAFNTALARAQSNLDLAKLTPARADDIGALHALIKLTTKRLPQLAGYRRQHDWGPWQSAISQETSSVATSLAGFRGDLKDIAHKPGPDDITIGIPSHIAWEIERTGLTPGVGDDIKAYTAKKKWLLAHMPSKKGAKRTAFQRELARTNLELDALGVQKTTDDAQAAADASAIPDLPLDIQEALANATLTPDQADDLAALSAERDWLQGQIAKSTDQAQRIGLTNELGDVLGQIRGITDTASSSGDGSGAGVSADTQAQIDQANRNAGIAVRGQQLSDAQLRAMTGSGDIGEGYASAFDAARGGPTLAILGDVRSALAVASAAATGVGLQPSVSANRGSLNI